VLGESEYVWGAQTHASCILYLSSSGPAQRGATMNGRFPLRKLSLICLTCLYEVQIGNLDMALTYIAGRGGTTAVLFT
jgi:hypothetical protein